jgi:hypothetical protein
VPGSTELAGPHQSRPVALGSPVFRNHHITNTLRELTGQNFTPSLLLITWLSTIKEKHPQTLSG